MFKRTTLAGQRWEADNLIDLVAGEVRTRYITEVPGQQAVYMTKLSQATEYAAAYALDAQAPVPPYIAAEATAMGVSAIATANNILAVASAWNTSVGPAIEAARLGGKKAVSEATLLTIQQVLVDAMAALRAL